MKHMGMWEDMGLDWGDVRNKLSIQIFDGRRFAFKTNWSEQKTFERLSGSYFAAGRCYPNPKFKEVVGAAWQDAQAAGGAQKV